MLCVYVHGHIHLCYEPIVHAYDGISFVKVENVLKDQRGAPLFNLRAFNHVARQGMPTGSPPGDVTFFFNQLTGK